jgi:ribosome maturation factor RimP
MIQKDTIEKLALQALTEEFFIVSISIKKGNVIEVVIDGDNGVNIQKCVDVSRVIEHNLDRDAEDFELSVYSAGLGRPFVVQRQYKKNIGKEVEVILAEGKPIVGTIQDVGEEGFDLCVTQLEKTEDKKKKMEVTKTIRFLFEEKPEVKNIISFK